MCESGQPVMGWGYSVCNETTRGDTHPRSTDGPAHLPLLGVRTLPNGTSRSDAARGTGSVADGPYVPFARFLKRSG